VAGIASVKLERDEIRFIIERVPAFICPACEEAYLDEDVAVRALTDANAMADAGLIEGSRPLGS